MIKTKDEVKEAFPEHVEFPMEYFPHGIGPGGFDPQVMYLHALAVQQGMLHELTMKSWVLLWLLDHVNWKKVKETHEINFGKVNPNG